MRVALNVAAGYNYEGSHLETKGLTPEGRVIPVPLHEHAVSLDYVRTEFEVEYTFAANWDLILRIPLDIKNQSSDVKFLEPASSLEQDAMLRNMNIHHRNETYRGLADVTLMTARRQYSLLREGDYLKIAFGATLPAGRTEQNPYDLGRRGLQHLHIQFGTGTVNPILETYYRLPLAGAFAVSPFFSARFPLYENDKTYQGPVELTSGASVSYRLNPRLTFHANFTHFRQGFAHWGRLRDLNTGLNATSGTFGMMFKAGEHTALGVDFRQPLGQSRLAAGGDSFRQGPTLLVRISRVFLP